MAKKSKKNLTQTQQMHLIEILKLRFEKNMNRHQGFDWSAIQTSINKNTQGAWSLFQMEESGGEPDVVDYDQKTNQYIFYDCSVESPKGRRSLCYDQDALDSRKENKPKNSALAYASEMGIELLNETQYRRLQTLGTFDTKTSSWVLTPSNIRELGGAIFCDCRYGQVFTYHNGAESYYAARGFRGFCCI